jgi:hypothetical protein
MAERNAHDFGNSIRTPPYLHIFSPTADRRLSRIPGNPPIPPVLSTGTAVATSYYGF